MSATPPAEVPVRPRLLLIAAGIACGGCALCSVAIYAIYFARHPLQDWMVYYGAARSYLDGNLPLIFDGERFTASLNAAFAAWLPEPFAFRSWAYPPPYLLLLLPFGLLSFVASYVLFQVTTLAALLAAIWQFVGRFHSRLLHTFALVLAPAAAFNLGTGQNGFLTAALLVGGVGALERHPRLAGALLGLLTYKPQFWPLAPLALAADRQWRALASTIATAGVIALASLGVFGAGLWRTWLEWAISPPASQYENFLSCCRLHDESVYTNLILLGASKAVADLAQLAAVLTAAGCVWWGWTRPMARELRLALLLAATALAAPHFANYDAVLLVVAAALAFSYGLDNGFRLGGAVVPVLVWMMQLLNPPDVFRIGRITPLLTVLLIACIFHRAHAVSDHAGLAALRPAARPGRAGDRRLRRGVLTRSGVPGGGA